MPRRSPGRPQQSSAHRWDSSDDEALLRVRFRDLHLRPRASLIWPDVERLYAELVRRNIRFRPHVWFSTEWFSPDGVPGIAVPFYVGHPRLHRLESRMMGEVEGSNRKWRLRILRHEAGHALDTAYGLRRRADWRAIFGPASTPYPRDYRAEPRSRAHVLHLGHWYAQSHPAEDFAETFAVWMQPKARWRRDYAGWPALRKLEYVDALMREIAGREPRTRDRSVVAPLSDNSRTLGEHYRRRRGLYADVTRRYDAWLERTFTSRAARPRAVRASRFIREIRPQLRRLLVRRARLHPYVIEHAIDTLRRRARQLDLVLREPTRVSRDAVLRLHERVIGDLLRRNRESYTL